MRRALIVGIDDYPDAPLAGCVKDADAIDSLLLKHHDGSPNFATRKLTMPPDTITRRVLYEQIEELFGREADFALLYFSGHGTENNLGGYLVTPDADRYEEGVSMVDVLARANNSPAREVLILLDCCHSGNLGTVPAISNERSILREGLSILTASRSAEAAVETDGRGLFTTLLCGALGGGAADVVGDVTVASIYAYVDQSLGAWDQRPLFKAFVSRLSSIRRSPPAVAPEILRRLPHWFDDPSHEMPLDPSFEPTAEPHDVDNERVFGDLQKCRAAKLIEPVGEDHLYFAAMNRKSCRLTALGRHYWRLANEGHI